MYLKKKCLKAWLECGSCTVVSSGHHIMPGPISLAGYRLDPFRIITISTSIVPFGVMNWAGLRSVRFGTPKSASQNAHFRPWFGWLSFVMVVLLTANRSLIQTCNLFKVWGFYVFYVLSPHSLSYEKLKPLQRHGRPRKEYVSPHVCLLAIITMLLP